jgi:hypothetical protein
MPLVVCSNCGRVYSGDKREVGEECGAELKRPTRFDEDVPECNGKLEDPKPRTSPRRRRSGRRPKQS